MNRLTIFNTYVQSGNLGDAIIMHYAEKQLRSIFPRSYFFHASTHEFNGKASYNFINRTKDQIVCGTNLLNNKVYKYRQWKIGLRDALHLNATLMGVGTSSYFEKLDFLSRKLYGLVLAEDRIQSVRDSYTEEIMVNAGFKNVLNTGCPTTWGLTEDLILKVSQNKASRVITTITDYKGLGKNDKDFILFLQDNYEAVFLWPQGFNDIKLLEKLGRFEKLTILSPSLESLNQILLEDDVEYIGTRLHAGIHALNNKKRTLILAVDNRALEMGKSIGLPVIKRKHVLDYLPQYINSSEIPKVRIPIKEIEVWKNQFRQQEAFS